MHREAPDTTSAPQKVYSASDKFKAFVELFSGVEHLTEHTTHTQLQSRASMQREEDSYSDMPHDAAPRTIYGAANCKHPISMPEEYERRFDTNLPARIPPSSSETPEGSMVGISKSVTLPEGSKRIYGDTDSLMFTLPDSYLAKQLRKYTVEGIIREPIFGKRVSGAPRQVITPQSSVQRTREIIQAHLATNPCTYCQTKNAEMQCSACGTRYCHRICQRQDWPLHKPKCKGTA